MTSVLEKPLTQFQTSALKRVRADQPFKPVSDKSNVYKFLRNRGLTEESETGHYTITQAGRDAITPPEGTLQ